MRTVTRALEPLLSDFNRNTSRVRALIVVSPT
jgi:hypothetical protein